MSGLKLYHNGENKVLMSAGERLIRQPYEFGNGIIQPSYKVRIMMPDEAYITTLETGNIYSGEYSGGKVVMTGGEFITTSIFPAGNLYYTSSGGSDYYPTQTPKYSVIPTIFTHIDLLNKKFSCRNILGIKSGDVSLPSMSKLDYYETFYGRGPINSIKLHRVAFFNRDLSVAECLFYVNNLLYNEFQLINGLICDVLMVKAEILDFSTVQDGSDMRVGCRDYSGYNRHGEIMNLPAGTLAEKLAYANANLFVQFIS